MVEKSAKTSNEMKTERCSRKCIRSKEHQNVCNCLFFGEHQLPDEVTKTVYYNGSGPDFVKCCH